MAIRFVDVEGLPGGATPEERARAAQLEALQALHELGTLSDEEVAAAHSRLVERLPPPSGPALDPSHAGPDVRGSVDVGREIGPNYSLFRYPIWRDWIAWLAVVGVFAGTRAAVADSVAVTSNSFNTIALLIDVPINVGLTVALFGILPASIRRWVSRRRRTQRASSTPPRAGRAGQAFAFLVLLPAVVGLVTAMTVRESATAAERAACEQAREFNEEFNAVRRSPSRAGFQRYVDAANELTRLAALTENSELADNARRGEDALSLMLGFVADGDRHGAEEAGMDGDISFNRLARECRRLNVPLPAPEE